MDSLDSWANIVQIASFVLPIFLFAFLFWIRAEIGKIQREQKPNGGSSMRDALNRIEDRQQAESLKLDAVVKDLATLRGSYDEYTKENRRGNR
jgi:hypothetical protein